MLDAFENAFANAPIGMALIDMAGHFLQVNDALCRITGYKRGELILMSARGLSHDQLVVEAVVGIAQGMGKKTVAESVGDLEMTNRLRHSGVDYAQGYHIGMPKPVSEVFAQL